jgi:hypothetical protein
MLVSRLLTSTRRRGSDQRRMRVPGIGERAHTVACAGSGVEIDEARFTRRLGVSIGHAHGNALMQKRKWRKSDGESFRNGNSFDPGLPRLFVTPCRRNRS